MDLDAFYTDAGVLPRTLLRIQRFRFSFHAMVGGRQSEEILFLIAAAFALLLLIGALPRLAAFASWLLLASLQARNPLVLNHGDELLRIFLFWSMFVPLSCGLRSSPDGKSKRHLSLFSAALAIQVLSVYFFGALLKSDPSWRVTGTAIHSALSLEQFTTGFGRELLGWPVLLKIATLCVYYLELLCPLLLFVPWGSRRIREVAVLSFAAIHLGIAATMRLGLFPWVSLLGWVLFLPSETLDMLERFVGPGPAGRTPRPAEDRTPGMLARVASRALGVYLLSAVLIWNIRGLNTKAEEVRPSPLDLPMLAAQLDQRWNMFAPKPNYICGWYVAPAELADGSKADLLDAGPALLRERPGDVSATYPDFRWRRYLLSLWRPQFERYRQALGAFLRRRWDGGHPGTRKVEHLTVYFVWQDLSAGENPPLKTTTIASE